MKNRSYILGLLALGVALSGCGTIQPGEVGVRKSMGVLDKSLLAPGMYTYNFMTDHVDVFSIKQETVEGSATPLTSDQQPITLNFKVQYRVPQEQVLNLYANVKGDPYGTLVAPQIQEAFRQVVSQYKADAVIGGVNKIKEEALALARKNLNGLMVIVDIPITHIELPGALQQAIIEKQQMEISAKKKQYELDRERKQAEIVVTKAKAEAESIRLQSQALANSPKLVDLKWVEKWNGKLPDTVAGGNSLIISPKR